MIFPISKRVCITFLPPSFKTFVCHLIAHSVDEIGFLTSWYWCLQLDHLAPRVPVADVAVVWGHLDLDAGPGLHQTGQAHGCAERRGRGGWRRGPRTLGSLLPRILWHGSDWRRLTHYHDITWGRWRWVRTEQHVARGVPRVSVENDEQQRIDKRVHKSDVQSYLEQKQQCYFNSSSSASTNWWRRLWLSIFTLR